MNTHSISCNIKHILTCSEYANGKSHNTGSGRTNNRRNRKQSWNSRFWKETRTSTFERAWNDKYYYRRKKLTISFLLHMDWSGKNGKKKLKKHLPFFIFLPARSHTYEIVQNILFFCTFLDVRIIFGCEDRGANKRNSTQIHFVCKNNADNNNVNRIR